MSWTDTPKVTRKSFLKIREGIMRDTIGKSTFICFFLFAAFCLYPAMSHAALAVQTEVVSGIISQKYDNHAVKLDNGKIYQPSREGLVVTVQAGDPVTLRYVVGDSNKNVFFEFAPGLHSLKNQEPASAKKDNSPK